MSYWKAYALAREVPESELREALVHAYEHLFEAENSLKNPSGAMRVPTGAEIADGVQELWADAQAAEERASDAEESERHERVEGLLQEKASLEEENASLKKELEEERATRLAGERLDEATSDLLTMARRFVSSCEARGVAPKHVRLAGAKPAKKRKVAP